MCDNTAYQEKTYVATKQIGLWDLKKYSERIKKEKNKDYIWPGILPEDKKNNLPYKTSENELLCTLKPGANITLHKVLYDAKQTSRPGRFQCMEVSFNDKRGFAWTIYEGKTSIVPKPDKDRDHVFKIISNKSKRNWVEMEIFHDISIDERFDKIYKLWSTDDKGRAYSQQVNFSDESLVAVDGQNVRVTFTDVLPNEKYSCSINLGSNDTAQPNKEIIFFHDMKITKKMLKNL